MTFLLSHCTFCLRIAILADVHLNITEGADSDPPLGVYGEDSKMPLFEEILEDLHRTFHTNENNHAHVQ